ncbi:MAG TPA: glycosyltransferase [Candidatus Paceibacterota bacterium]|nr:glycosyltransferase [Candidatus Paceibacterota bacterium]
MPRKRILYVITKSNFGGAQRYVYDLATSLPKDSFEVAVAFGGSGAAGEGEGVLAGLLANAGVRTIHVPELARDIDLATDLAAYRALTALFLAEEPDAVHLNSSKAGGLGALAARRAGIPRIIYTAHGWPFTERVSPIAKAVRFLLSYATALLSTAIICVSKSDRRAARRMPFIGRKLIVIHNGARPIAGTLDREAARAALSTSPEEQAQHAHDLWVLSIAELVPNKNLFRAARAVALANEGGAVPRIFLTIFGEGQERKRLEDFLDAQDLAGTVRLAGFVPESRRYLAAFDALLLPSLKEGFPYAILEAAAAGLPVAASAAGGIPEIIVHGQTGLLIEHPADAQDIARELNSLRDPAYRELLANGLHDRAEQEFSFEAMRAATIALYQ